MHVTVVGNLGMVAGVGYLFVTSAAPVHYWWVCHQCFDMMARSAHPEVVERDRDRHITNRHRGWEPTETEAALVRWPPERATP